MGIQLKWLEINFGNQISVSSYLLKMSYVKWKYGHHFSMLQNNIQIGCPQDGLERN
jgi:hypothetical protein